MSYVIQAVLSNPRRPECGQITIPFPIPVDQYDQTIEMLQKVDLGFSVNRDCTVDEVNSRYNVLNALVGTLVNIDQLDYLAKRLDSFCSGEVSQFEAMAHKLGLADIKDFINLTYCCQQATVITDFSNLEAVGRSHFMALNGGCARMEELESLDGAETALLLIDGGGGVVTPYGVVYDNGMVLEQQYNGHQFPAYPYDSCFMVLEITPKHGLAEGKNPEYLYLPAAEHQIERTLLRVGITALYDAQVRLDFDELPEKVAEALDLEHLSGDDLPALNRMCQAIVPLKDADIEKLNAVVLMTEASEAEPCMMYCEIKAVLSNARHPERGQVTVPFPIPQDAYEQTIEALEALGIGDALERDCRVDELDSGYPVLKRLEGTEVNVDELNYLGEWLDSEEEAAQFQDMAHKLGPFDIQDFINLTFRCGQGGAEPKRQYDGRYLPPYIHEPPVAVVEVVSEQQGETRAFCLPISELRLQRIRRQAGADSLGTRLRLAADRIPEKVAEALDLERLSGDDLPCLNRLCQSIQPLRDKGREKLSAVTLMTETSGIVSICRLAENLDQFDFVPGVRTPEEYGRHMIQKSGHFDFDENLEGFYDYRRYGEQRIQQEGGQFNECGYVVYQGEVPLEELMRGTSEEQRQGPQMGGLSC